MFAGHKAQVGHELAWMREAAYVAQFTDERERRNECNTTEGTECGDGASVTFFLGFILQMCFDRRDLNLEVVNQVYVRVEHGLIDIAELDLGQPEPETLTPVRAVSVDEAAGLQEFDGAVFGSGQIRDERRAASHEGAGRLEFFVRNVDSCQEPGCIQGGKLFGIAAIGLDAVAATTRDRRGSDDIALDPQISKLSI